METVYHTGGTNPTSACSLFLEYNMSAITEVDQRVINAIVGMRQTINGVDGRRILVLLFLSHSTIPQRLKIMLSNIICEYNVAKNTSKYVLLLLHIYIYKVCIC